MRTGQATGLQVAFLMLALMLLAVPLAQYLVKAGSLSGPSRILAESGTQFLLAGIVIAAFPALRQSACLSLSTPIPPSMRSEVALVALAKLPLAFATAAGIALWLWATQGPPGLDRIDTSAPREAARAFSDSGLARLFLMVLVGPIVEELVFRGFMYRAFERQWGWFSAMLATSALFGLYHPHFWSAFASSVLFVCLLRRTGSIRAPIAAHMLFNLMLWWPLLGQYVFPHGVPLDELSTWRFHIGCSVFTAIALPAYVWLARDRSVIAPTAFLEPNGALPK
jgi:membrane protease YdiL (CAAX protease family)